jgi:hypothetical protein
VDVFDLVSAAAARFAIGFAVPAAFCVVLAVVGLRDCDRVEAAFWTTRFEAVGFVRPILDFVARVWTTFGWGAFTRPRIARPDDRPFAAAFAVARRVDLLCEVEAMGTTLVTVATW